MDTIPIPNTSTSNAPKPSPPPPELIPQAGTAQGGAATAPQTILQTPPIDVAHSAVSIIPPAQPIRVALPDGFDVSTKADTNAANIDPSIWRAKLNVPASINLAPLNTRLDNLEDAITSSEQTLTDLLEDAITAQDTKIDDKLSKSLGGTVMGATTFASNLTATQPPTQPNHVTRKIDLLNERGLLRVAEGVLEPAAAQNSTAYLDFYPREDFGIQNNSGSWTGVMFEIELIIGGAFVRKYDFVTFLTHGGNVDGNGGNAVNPNGTLTLREEIVYNTLIASWAELKILAHPTNDFQSVATPLRVALKNNGDQGLPLKAFISVKLIPPARNYITDGRNVKTSTIL